MNDYDEADEQLWGEAPPRDALDRALRAEDPFFRPEPIDVTTAAERKLDADLAGAQILLRDREYEKLAAALGRAALDARSLALLGPEGARGIPVDYQSSPNAPMIARRGMSYAADTGRSTKGTPAAKLSDSPAGAGHAVEAERG